MKTNRWRTRRGQSLVEMAMVLPLLTFLTFGLLDFGRAYYFQVAITNAAREGARSAILNVYTGPDDPACLGPSYSRCPVQSDTAIMNAVQQELMYSGIAPKTVTICPPHDSSMSTASCPDSSNRVDNWINGTDNYYVAVRVTYDFTLYTPLMRQLLGNPITMNVAVQMRTNY
jgi:hypothetical protein